MTTFFLIVIAVLLLIIIAFYWHQFQQDDVEEVLEDQRVPPLLRGINYLLSEEPDLALREMVKVAKLDSEAVEVYMSLGEMFRSKGEIGRAVRIHQNILARPDVSKKLYAKAQYSLAKDFQTGGLLDRALRHYQKVLDVDSGHIEALTAALRIREQSHEWQEAEQLLSRLERLQGDKALLHRAYLLAEMAETALDVGDIQQAEQLSQDALALDMQCVHAHEMMLRIAIERGDHKALQQHMQTANEYVAAFVALFVPVLLQEGFESNAETLMASWQLHHDEELALSWIEYIAEHQGIEAAQKLKEKLGFSPKKLRSVLRLAAVGMSSDKALLKEAKQWRLTMKRHACQQCGVQVVDMRWQCPQCCSWGSMVFINDGHKE